MPLDYQTVALPELKRDIASVTREIKSAFGGLRVDQLNWKPQAEQWSIAQCLEHLLISNQQYEPLLDRLIHGQHLPSFWESVPLVPRVFGWLLIRSFTVAHKRKAPPGNQPTRSAIAPDIVARFVSNQHDFLLRLEALAEFDLGNIIVTSPFVRVVTYSVLDLFRLSAAHYRRHLAQALRVRQAPNFPQ